MTSGRNDARRHRAPVYIDVNIGVYIGDVMVWLGMVIQRNFVRRDDRRRRRETDNPIGIPMRKDCTWTWREVNSGEEGEGIISDSRDIGRDSSRDPKDEDSRNSSDGMVANEDVEPPRGTYSQGESLAGAVRDEG